MSSRPLPVAYRVVVALVVVYLVLFFTLSVAAQAALGIAVAPMLIERALAAAAWLRHATFHAPTVPGR